MYTWCDMGTRVYLCHEAITDQQISRRCVRLLYMLQVTLAGMLGVDKPRQAEAMLRDTFEQALATGAPSAHVCASQRTTECASLAHPGTE